MEIRCNFELISSLTFKFVRLFRHDVLLVVQFYFTLEHCLCVNVFRERLVKAHLNYAGFAKRTIQEAALLRGCERDAQALVHFLVRLLVEEVLHMEGLWVHNSIHFAHFYFVLNDLNCFEVLRPFFWILGCWQNDEHLAVKSEANSFLGAVQVEFGRDEQGLLLHQHRLVVEVDQGVKLLWRLCRGALRLLGLFRPGLRFGQSVFEAVLLACIEIYMCSLCDQRALVEQARLVLRLGAAEEGDCAHTRLVPD